MKTIRPLDLKPLSHLPFNLEKGFDGRADNTDDYITDRRLAIKVYSARVRHFSDLYHAEKITPEVTKEQLNGLFDRLEEQLPEMSPGVVCGYYWDPILEEHTSTDTVVPVQYYDGKERVAWFHAYSFRVLKEIVYFDTIYLSPSSEAALLQYKGETSGCIARLGQSHPIELMSASQSQFAVA